jgi:hypothetical protein
MMNKTHETALNNARDITLSLCTSLTDKGTAEDTGIKITTATEISSLVIKQYNNYTYVNSQHEVRYIEV